MDKVRVLPSPPGVESLVAADPTTEMEIPAALLVVMD
jgi:hypothetical protein